MIITAECWFIFGNSWLIVDEWEDILAYILQFYDCFIKYYKCFTNTCLPQIQQRVNNNNNSKQ